MLSPRAEYRQQEGLRINASPNLADKFRALKTLMVDLAYYDDEGVRPNVSRIPWHAGGPDEYPENGSLLKNRWVEVRHRGRSAYGQWEDVGPNEEDDPDYVFGDAEPKNTFGERAGIDVSPALCDYLGIEGSAQVVWRFVEASDVPPGPWTEIITTSGPRWG